MTIQSVINTNEISFENAVDKIGGDDLNARHFVGQFLTVIGGHQGLFKSLVDTNLRGENLGEIVESNDGRFMGVWEELGEKSNTPNLG